MEDKNFEPELNEELFDNLCAAMEEELEKYGMPKRFKYAIIAAVNKNLEKKLEGTRVDIHHIVKHEMQPGEKMSFASAPGLVQEHGIFKSGLVHDDAGTFSFEGKIRENNTYDTLSDSEEKVR